MKVLLTGASGQLGTAVTRLVLDEGLCGEDMELVALTREQLDISRPSSVEEELTRLKPDWVINCAAYTDVNRSESDILTAFAVNAVGPALLARRCFEMGARLAHVSTDYVFDGESKKPYTETDSPHPINSYGVTKLAGEHLVLQRCPGALVVRTSGLYGFSSSHPGNNFVEKILKRAKEGPLRVVADQTTSPSFAEDVGRRLLDLVSLQASGLYHASNAGAITWHRLAEEIVRLVGWSVEVVPIDSEAYPSPARRPSFSALTSVRNEELGLSPLRSWKDALKSYLIRRGLCR